jgi:uncharacterized protein YjbI with pentapeptide repeats
VIPVAVQALPPVACGTVLWHYAGALRVSVVVKATFNMTPEADASIGPARPLATADRFAGSPGASSLVEPSDLAPFLTNAGIIVLGHVYSPGGRPVQAMSARLAVMRRGAPILDKALHVYGDRRASAPHSAQPFVRMPLAYERAFGGRSFPENPIGVGADEGLGGVLPNLLHTQNPRIAASFGPLPANMPARSRFAAGFDLKSLREPIPQIPDRLDFRFFHPAPADQQISGYFEGDEWIVLDGMHPSFPRLMTRLPGLRAEARHHRTGDRTPTPIELAADTVAVDTDAFTLSVLWRGSFVVATAADLAHVSVTAGAALPGVAIQWPALDEAPPRSDSRPSYTPAPKARDDGEVTMAVRPGQQANAHTLPFRAGAAAAPSAIKASPFPPVPALSDASGKRATLQREEAPAGSPLPFRPKGASSESADAPDHPPHPAATLDVPPPAPPRFVEPPLQKQKQKPPPAASTEPPLPAPPPMVGLIRGGGPALGFPPPAPAFAAAPSPPAPSPPTPSPPAPVRATPDEDDFDLDDKNKLISINPPPPPAFVGGGASKESAEEPRPPSPGRDRALEAIAEKTSLAGADLAGADLSDLDLRENSLEGATLTGAKLLRCKLARSRLAKANLRGADLSGADLAGADLAGADLSNAELAGAKLDGATLENAFLTGARGEGATFIDAKAAGLSLAKGYFKNADFRGLQAKGADLSGAVLTEANLAHAVLTQAKLTDVSAFRTIFQGARLEKATAINAHLAEAVLDAIVAPSSVWDGAKLDGASIQGADLTKASFVGAKLDGAKLNGSKLKGALLREASLSKAILIEADLGGARLARATSEGAVFDRAVLDGADLRLAKLSGATFTEASLRGVKGDNLDATRSRFDKADLRKAAFCDGTFQGADLSTAQLDETDLRDADLTGTALRETDLANAKIEGAALGPLGSAPAPL